MGREIRRVPANWQHPKYTEEDAPYPNRIGGFKPLFEDYKGALESFQKDIEKMGLSEAIEYHGGGPRVDDYAQYGEQELTWWQVYETVSEGTPVSPAFGTAGELIEYLVENGDFWDQLRRAEGGPKHGGPWSRTSAERFVKEAGWAPSFIGTSQTGIISGIEALDQLPR